MSGAPFAGVVRGTTAGDGPTVDAWVAATTSTEAAMAAYRLLAGSAPDTGYAVIVADTRYERRGYACDNGSYDDGVECLKCEDPPTREEIERAEAGAAAYAAGDWARFRELVQADIDAAAAKEVDRGSP